MPAGRPKLNQMVMRLHIQLSLREGEDDDLINALRTIPARKRASFIKSAMRSGGMQQLNLDDLPDDDELADSLENFLV